MFEPITLAAAIVPVVIDGLKTLFTKWVNKGNVPTPQTVEQLLALGEQDIRRFEALAQMDTIEGISQWVANIRALMRPVAVVIILMLLGIALLLHVDPYTTQSLFNLSSMVVFYLFGERTAIKWRAS